LGQTIVVLGNVEEEEPLPSDVYPDRFTANIAKDAAEAEYGGTYRVDQTTDGKFIITRVEEPTLQGYKEKADAEANALPGETTIQASDKSYINVKQTKENKVTWTGSDDSVYEYDPNTGQTKKIWSPPPPGAMPTEEPTPGYKWQWDSTTRSYVQKLDPDALTDYQKSMLSASAADLGLSQQQFEFQKEKWADELGLTREQLELDTQKWQATQAESQRRYEAELAADASRWLEKSAYAGQAPTIQDWMVGLLPPGYKAGDPFPEEWLPGYQSQGTPYSKYLEKTKAAMPSPITTAAPFWTAAGGLGQNAERTTTYPNLESFIAGTVGWTGGKPGEGKRFMMQTPEEQAKAEWERDIRLGLIKAPYTQAGYNLPELPMPMWGRQSPQAAGEYGGYEQARTGESPEETFWKQRKRTAPSGSFTPRRY